MSDSDLRARIEATLGVVQVSDLEAHLARDAVLALLPGVDLVTCALAIAGDDAARVQTWLRQGALRRLGEAEREAWRQAPATRRWLACVVQPFVVAQELPDEALA